MHLSSLHCSQMEMAQVSLLASKSLIFLKLIKSWWGKQWFLPTRIQKLQSQPNVGGNHLLAFTRKNSTLTEGITWGITAQVGERIADPMKIKPSDLVSLLKLVHQEVCVGVSTCTLNPLSSLSSSLMPISESPSAILFK